MGRRLPVIRLLFPSKKTALCLNSAFFGFYAHTGFLKAFEEIGMRANMVSGCSAGALTGALYCSGMSPDQIIKLLSTLKKKDFWEGNFIYHFVKPFIKGFSNYTGLLKGSKFKKKLIPHFGNRKIEDCPIPLSIAAANLTDGKMEIFKEGDLLGSVLCSCAFPILFEIQNMNGKEYIDGGLADHEPILDFILDKNVDKIIIHSVITKDENQSGRLKQSFRNAVDVIENETGRLKEWIAHKNKKKILRIVSTTESCGPDKLHKGLSIAKQVYDSLKKENSAIHKWMKSGKRGVTEIQI